MSDKQRMLVAVDDSDASRRTVSYVAAFLAGCADISVRLLHVLPHLPPKTLKWGGTADPPLPLRVGFLLFASDYERS